MVKNWLLVRRLSLLLSHLAWTLGASVKPTESLRRIIKAYFFNLLILLHTQQALAQSAAKHCLPDREGRCMGTQKGVVGDGEHNSSLSAASSAQRLLGNFLAQCKLKIFYQAGQRSQLSGMSLKLFFGLGWNVHSVLQMPHEYLPVTHSWSNSEYIFYRRHLSITVDELLICSLGANVEKSRCALLQLWCQNQSCTSEFFMVFYLSYLAYFT